MKNLEELYIVGSKRGGKIDELPKGITKLKKLNALRLGCNNLTEFPKELCNLVNLEYLEFSSNRINKLPKI